MFFRKKCSRKTEPSTIEVTEIKTTDDESKLDLNDMIKACDYYKGTDNEEFLVKLLADSLLNGTNGIQINYELALTYYQRLSRINPIAGQCGMGKTNIAIGLKDDDRFQFCLGVNNVYEAYLKGCDDAKPVLEFLAESGLFEDVSTFDEMIQLCQRSNVIVS